MKHESCRTLILILTLLALSPLQGGENALMPPAEKANVTTVTSIKELQETVAKTEVGTTILLKNGKYTERCDLKGKGSKERPIVVRAETIGGVELLNQVTLEGEYVAVMGFNFTDKGFVSISGKGCRLSRCHMTNVQNGQWVIVSAGSREVEIDHCLFEKKESNKTLSKGCQVLKIGVLNKGEKHHIHHNHFRDIPKGKTGNGFETIQLITQGNPFDPKKGDCKTVIEDNLFERCNGEAEIISVKSNGNVIRRNTVRACAGSLVLRHGDANVAAGNFFFGDGEKGSGGVRLQGVDQVVVNNYFQDLGQAAIAMMDGTPDNLYVRVERATVAHNTVVNCGYAMEIGLNHSKHPNGTVPKDCVIAGNIFFSQGDGERKAIRFVQDDQPEGWVWVDNVVKGDLGSPPCEGIVTGDPQLAIVDKNVALPTKDTPMSKHTLNDVNALSGDLFGNPRKNVRTIGCVQFPVERQDKGPLTEKQVGPDAAEPLSTRDAGR